MTNFGYVVVGIFIANWPVSMVIYRLKRYDRAAAIVQQDVLQQRTFASSAPGTSRGDGIPKRREGKAETVGHGLAGDAALVNV
jgi:hypothetical protein